MEKYIVGIDLGGMSAKAGLFTLGGELLESRSHVTCASDGFDGTMRILADLAKETAAAHGVSFDEVAAIGSGSPGVVDRASGTVLRWSTYAWDNVPFAKALSSLTGKPVFVTNDANAAALGEARFGATSKYQSSVLLTLGTGIGSGIIYEGKLIEGYKSAGAELGHTTIREGGIPCACGRNGCFEKYASASALIAQTKRAMLDNLHTSMWQVVDGKIENVDGRTAFMAAKDGDATAKKVVEQFIDYLAEGIANFVNILRPEVIALGGGISNEGETLLEPLRVAVNKRTYVAMDIVPLKIIRAELGNKAGMYGAFALAKDALNN